MTDLVTRALVVGIDEYPYLDPDRRLHGAVADADAIADLLRKKIVHLDQRILIDSAATHDAVLASLDSLIEATRPDEAFLFYWSGHGSQVCDVSDDEDDGWDETLVPYDSGRGRYPNKDVIDDEIFKRILALSEVTDRITFILDSCHSGTAVRSGVRGVPRDPRPRAKSADSSQGKAIGRTFEKPRGASGWLPLSDKYVLLAACRDDQEALEVPFRGQMRGAFTWTLCRELERAPENAGWASVFNPVAGRLAFSTTGAQIPQIEGDRNRGLPWARQ